MHFGLTGSSAGAGSLWRATAPPGPVCPALTERTEADIVIVGAGYTGLSTAIHLAERGRSVCVVEAAEPGAGASGLNGGQVIAGLRHLPGELLEAYGRERGARLHAFGAATADAAFDLIRRHGIACEVVRTGWIQGADTEAALRQAAERVAAWRATGAPVRLLDAAEFHALVGSRSYLGGWIDERGGTVQPLAYARGLARAALKLGVRLFSGSAVHRITPAGRGWRVETPGGAVEAPRLLIATNALTGDLAAPLGAAILPVWSFQVATRPLDAATRARILPRGQPVSDTRRVLRYFRLDAAGRLVVGGKGTIGAPRGPGSFDLQRRIIRRLYPELDGIEITHRWGGQVAVTADRLPRLFALGPGAYASFGCNGKGVAWCSALGPLLADLLTGADPDRLVMPVTPLSTIPFHVLRRLYVALGSTWLRLRDALER
jgi:glycine/D-amino acid oxidase-like deaminating enzyme